MNLNKKKELAARTLNVGLGRILFNSQRLNDIKEAITKQDIKDLKADGAIFIKEIKGRRKHVKRKTRRRIGSRKKKVMGKKRVYVILTRKLRRYLALLKKQGSLSQENFLSLRKKIKTNTIQSLAQLKEIIKGVER